MPNDLDIPFNNYKSTAGKSLHKNLIYARTYDELFSSYRGKDVVLVEMGIGYGGCLQMWKEYLGDKARIYGLDYHTEQFYEESQIKCIQCDQSSKESLSNAISQLPGIDIFIDDGSHIGWHQVQTFEAIFPILKSSGYYCCEDIATNYRRGFEGGYLQENTFVEYCKQAEDIYNYTEDERMPRNNAMLAAYYVAFYKGLIVIKKR